MTNSGELTLNEEGEGGCKYTVADWLCEFFRADGIRDPNDVADGFIEMMAGIGKLVEVAELIERKLSLLEDLKTGIEDIHNSIRLVAYQTHQMADAIETLKTRHAQPITSGSRVTAGSAGLKLLREMRLQARKGAGK